LEALGWAVANCGRYAEACAILKEGAAAYENRGARMGYLMAIEPLGLVEAHLGQYEKARETGRRVRALGGNAAWVLALQGIAALGAGKAEEAWKLLEEGAALHRKNGGGDHHSLGLYCGGYAARRAGYPDQARRYLCRCLQVAAEIKSLWMLLYALPGVAALLVDQGEVEQAVEVYALAVRYPFVANSRWFEDVAGVDVAAAAEALPPEVVRAAQARGRAADPWAVAADLLRELEG
jgi:tetratricopeptide (TPR) repeat protein